MGVLQTREIEDGRLSLESFTTDIRGKEQRLYVVGLRVEGGRMQYPVDFKDCTEERAREIFETVESRDEMAKYIVNNKN